MNIHDVVRQWKDTVGFAFSSIALVVSLSGFYFSTLYVNETLEATLTGPISFPRDDQDRIGVRFAIVNNGTRHAALLETALLIWNSDVHNHGEGYHWDVMPGQESKSTAIKPGEIFILELVSSAHTRDDFVPAAYSIPLDATHKQVVFGVRMKTMDSKGTVYSSTYVVSNFLLKHEWQRGPNDGFTFERAPRQLFANRSETPQKVHNYPSELP